MRIVERAEAAPYVNYPPTPWWYSPVIGLWAAGMIGAFTWWRSNAVLFIASVVILILTLPVVAILIALAWWQIGLAAKVRERLG